MVQAFYKPDVNIITQKYNEMDNLYRNDINPIKKSKELVKTQQIDNKNKCKLHTKAFGSKKGSCSSKSKTGKQNKCKNLAKQSLDKSSGLRTAMEIMKITNGADTTSYKRNCSLNINNRSTRDFNIYNFCKTKHCTYKSLRRKGKETIHNQ